ncbi:hypothetical protein ESA94_13710 [Lacibacter luteus]|uniref:DUF4890 domain-containing protein n=1 Tax=Lacibacter luteus TaxID=2508719 RepID=A0A4Q1CGF3_9BACT|nr:hypothetical protein [Lacibacter luteus]RXK59192.1 hypothetical protein ESA94_13710 [Lacibacter luteus]
MKFIKVLFSFFSFIGVLNQVSAQAPKELNQENSIAFAKRETDSLQKVLNLNINQAKQLNSIERTFLEKRLNIPRQITSSERAALIREIEIWHTNQLKEIFSAAQYKKYIEVVEEKKRKSIEKQKSFEQKHKKG